MDLTKFAEGDEDAELRASQFKDVDPFPSIEPALLSSAEIEDYARVTGMIYPFYRPELKSASYGAPICGAQIIYMPDGSIQKKIIDRSTACRLPANSISFVEIEPKFRLPNYMALRFNLAITHVHRGLLLGTGPLVDPGFSGRILIPLHNLTDSDCVILEGDNLVWIEFTKTTHGRGRPSAAKDADRIATPVPFPERKQNRLPEWYLNRAGHGEPIRSAIPKAVLESRDAARSSAASAEAIKNRIQVATVIGLVALGITLVGVLVQTHGLVQDAHNLSQTAVSTVATAGSEGKILLDRIQALDQEAKEKGRQLAIQNEAMARIAEELVVLRQQMSTLQIELQLIQGQLR